MRHDRGGPLLYPRAAVSSRPAGHHRSAPAASQRPALHPRCHNPSAREVVTRHQQRFTRLTRPIFPLPVAPGRNGNPSAFPPGFAPRRYQRRTPRWEQVSRTLTQSYTFDTVEPPNGKPTHYLRPRVALPSIPRGRRCSHDRRDVHGRRLPLPNGQPLSPRHHHPPRSARLTRHQQGFTGIHPSGHSPRL
jgi:hypothetical protein